MNTVAAIGDDAGLEGFALAGVQVLGAAGAAEITAAWDSLDESVGLVILSAQAAEVLASDLDHYPDRLTVVMQ